jgi:hypothetical protein
VNALIGNLGPDGLEINIKGKLRAEDYGLFKELVEQRIDRFGKVNLLVVITEFAGWTPTDLWQEIKFDVADYGNVGLLAIVGSVPLNHWMATLSKPFTSAVVRYYPVAMLEAAREWVRDLPLERLAHSA